MAGGRQREFDTQEALESAMQVFWKKGFLGASLTDLTESMGINKPSMYAAFGNKEQLFIQATEHYIDEYAKPPLEKLHEKGKTLRERIHGYLESVVTGQCSKIKGCYISLCVSEAAGEGFPDAAMQMVEHVRDFVEAYLTEFLTDEIVHDNLPVGTNVAQLSLTIATFMHGAAAMARAGKSKENLMTVVNNIVQMIPEEEKS